MNGSYLRAMLKTLVLLRMRCGCLDTEVELRGGTADSVWTLKKTTTSMFLMTPHVLLWTDKYIDMTYDVAQINTHRW